MRIRYSLPVDLTRPATLRFKLVLAVLTLAIAWVFLFARLGHYALWDDEAITALTAEGVLKTGDTSAVVGHNIVAFRNGLLLRNMKDRATPPLQFYLDAPFLAVFSHTALAARLPFAICGLGTIGLLLWWLHRDDASVLMWLLLCMGILGNVSLFLFARQARYYGLAIFLSVAIAYSYLHLRTRAGIAWHAVLSVLLLAANYMTFAAVSLAMALDYLIWGRKRRSLRGLDWVILFAPQLVIGAIVVSIWNPLRIAAEESKPGSWIGYKAKLLWWNIRDLNACEFGVGLLLVAAPIVAIITRSGSMLRAMLALVVSILVITIVSPQAVSNTAAADVRYLSFLIPLCIGIGVMTLLPLARLYPPMAAIASLALAAVAFGSNWLHGTPLWNRNVPFRWTVVRYARELRDPLADPFSAVAGWINQNVRDGDSVLVLPDYMMYPLMFYAPRAVYAWQLRDPPPMELEKLPPIHRANVMPPDYIVAYGPTVNTLGQIPYELVAQFPGPWWVTYRPELFWHQFEPPEQLRPGPTIFILKHVAPRLDFRL
jgi:4-amino-4-deoxy-L-arabinose transferase-like glycosyltransferase